MNKEKCLKVRYQFRDYYNDMIGKPQYERHEKWLDFVDSSDLTEEEKRICKKEFIPESRKISGAVSRS